jgi:dTDP-glucose 4,6-dehydratase
MRILITGAAGFIGSHLCDFFLEKGHFIIGLDNLLTGDKANISHLVHSKYFKFLLQDVSDEIRIKGELDAVLHFASPASPNPYSPYGYPNLPIETLLAGSAGTLNTLNLARKTHARFLVASTSEIYGDPRKHPQDEAYWGHVNPVGIRSMYDEAKRFCEAATMAYYRSMDTDTRILRIFNTYGPRMRIDDGRVVPNFIVQALQGKPLTIYGDGKQTRSFCYIDDLIIGIDKLLESEEHFPVNLGNPNETAVIDFARIINRLTKNQAGLDFKPQLRLADDPQRRCPDISRAKTILGWEPKVSLEEGLERTIEHFRKRLAMA